MLKFGAHLLLNRPQLALFGLRSVRKPHWVNKVFIISYAIHQLKDVTKYIPLFSQPGRMIVDLNNIIDESIGINGEYDGEEAIN